MPQSHTPSSVTWPSRSLAKPLLPSPPWEASQPTRIPISRLVACGPVTRVPTYRRRHCYRRRKARYRLCGLTLPDGTFTRRTAHRVSVLHPFLLSLLHFLVTPHVGPSRLDDAIVRTQARDALVALGWKPNIARTAVDEARSHGGRDVTIEELIRDALRRCPRPAS